MDLPKKFLRIHELTFALPDDFEGTVEDAMDLLLEYRTQHRNHRDNAEYMDPLGIFTTMECLIHASNGGRLCADEAIYELNGDAYCLYDASNPLRAAHHNLDKNTEDQKEKKSE